MAPAAPPADLRFRIGTPSPDGWSPVAAVSTGDTDGLTVRRGPGGWHFNFGNLAEFVVAGRDIVGRPLAEAPTAFRHLLIDQIVPFGLVLAGELILHASAVTLPGADRAAVFVGPSGAGKSSTAAACLAAGAGLLSDDFACIDLTADVPGVLASGAGVRLWPGAASLADGVMRLPVAEYSVKQRHLTGAATGSVAAGVLVRLAERGGDRVRISPQGPAEALITVIAHSYRLEVGDAALNRRILDDAARLTERVPVVTAVLPDDRGRLVEHCRDLLAQLDSLDQRA